MEVQPPGDLGGGLDPDLEVTGGGLDHQEGLAHLGGDHDLLPSLAII